MKVLYLDCGMGAAGDMLTAALLELFPEPGKMVEKLNSLGIPDVEFVAEKSVKCGITGTHMTVRVHGIEESEEMHEHDHHHEHETEHDHHHEHETEHDHHHEHDHDHDHHHHHHHDHDHSVACNEGHDHAETHEHVHSHGDGHSHHHTHHGLKDIEHVVKEHLNVPEKVREDILGVFGLIAEAESKVHGVPVTDIHFHEVGTMDAVADVAAVCVLLDELKPDEILASPVHVGCGQVKCAHGILPVPAPATALILKDVPVYGGEIRGELCTPTGAALLKHFVTRFGSMPVMRISGIGYGMGRKDFERANCVRALIGESGTGNGTAAFSRSVNDAPAVSCGAGSAAEAASCSDNDAVMELSCNVDDMTAESIAFATERLMEAGALDVYTVPIGMKKGRPGTLIRLLCTKGEEDRLAGVIFKHTSTLGIRKAELGRYVLKRGIETVETPLGPVRRKVSEGYGANRVKYEYEDLARLAREKDISIEEVLKIIKAT